MTGKSRKCHNGWTKKCSGRLRRWNALPNRLETKNARRPTLGMKTRSRDAYASDAAISFRANSEKGKSRCNWQCYTSTTASYRSTNLCSIPTKGFGSKRSMSARYKTLSYSQSCRRPTPNSLYTWWPKS